MNKEKINIVDSAIEKLYSSILDKPNKILQIFNDFFGEACVDMQGIVPLDKFKTWFTIIPIVNYIYGDNIPAEVDNGIWEKYKDVSITDIPEDIGKELVKCFTNDRVIYDITTGTSFRNIFILVHFPHVRVTNEHNRFVDITHLYAKVAISSEGTLNGSFQLNRAEYTIAHLRSNYMHSHVSSIPTYNFANFQNPCTGSGPINGTIAYLNRDFDEDLWNMFCLELSKYVTVESIAGTPYKYLERIGTEDMLIGESSFRTRLKRPYFSTMENITLKRFFKHFIEARKLKFNYVNGSYSIGVSFVEYITLISNEFISWYNNEFNNGRVQATYDTLKRSGLLKECIIDKGKVYYNNARERFRRYTEYIGKRVCTFKGKDVTINILDMNDTEGENKSIILDIDLALYLLTTTLRVLNYRYGREKAIREDSYIGTEVRYL